MNYQELIPIAIDEQVFELAKKTPTIYSIWSNKCLSWNENLREK